MTTLAVPNTQRASLRPAPRRAEVLPCTTAFQHRELRNGSSWGGLYFTSNWASGGRATRPQLYLKTAIIAYLASAAQIVPLLVFAYRRGGIGSAAGDFARILEVAMAAVGVPTSSTTADTSVLPIGQVEATRLNGSFLTLDLLDSLPTFGRSQHNSIHHKLFNIASEKTHSVPFGAGCRRPPTTVGIHPSSTAVTAC